jgi:hypothetical protein
MNLRIVEDTDDLLLLKLTGSLDLSGGRKSKPLFCSRDLGQTTGHLGFFTSNLSCLVRNENAL